MDEINNDEPIKYGCVKFDDTTHHDRGWASIAGQKPYRISSTKDLDSDVIWLTNLDYNMSFAAGMAFHAGFRRSEFLSEFFLKDREQKNYDLYDFSHILGTHYEDGPSMVYRTALVFERVMRITNKKLGLKDTPDTSLSHGLRDIIMGYDEILPKGISDALSSTCSKNVWVERENQYDDSSRWITLTLPRVMHSAFCSNVFLPAGDWVSIKPPNNTSEDIDDWLNDLGNYCIVQFSLSKMMEGPHRLVNYGSGRRSRSWATGIELSMLNKISDITIKKAYRPKDLTSIPCISSVLEGYDPLQELSVSAGFFWQNIWSALCVKKTPPPHIRKGRDSFNVVEPFVRAIDRNACLLASVELQNKGLSIVNYGKGKVTIQHDGDNQKLAEILRETCLIPPFLKEPLNKNVTIETPAKMLQEIYIQGDFDKLNSADQQVVEMLCQY